MEAQPPVPPDRGWGNLNMADDIRPQRRTWHAETALVAGVLTFAFSCAVAQGHQSCRRIRSIARPSRKRGTATGASARQPLSISGTAKGITLTGMTVYPRSVLLGGGDLYEA